MYLKGRVTEAMSEWKRKREVLSYKWLMPWMSVTVRAKAAWEVLGNSFVSYMNSRDASTWVSICCLQQKAGSETVGTIYRHFDMGSRHAKQRHNQPYSCIITPSQVCKYLLCVRGCSKIGCTHIYKCSFLWLNCAFSLYDHYLFIYCIVYLKVRKSQIYIQE